MIIEHDGRHFSVWSAKEAMDILGVELDNLTEGERGLLMSMVDEMMSGGDSVMRAAAHASFDRKPVSMEQFLDDEYYLGKSCATLYPRLREDLIELSYRPEVCEVVLGGAIGFGKTMFASIAIAWDLYKMSCITDPQSAFGLSSGSEIVFVAISKSLFLARTVLKSAVDDKLKLSGYFMDEFKPDFGKDVTRFPKNIILSIGSVASDRVIGTNTFGGVMDEANFMAGNKQVMKSGGRKSIASYDAAEKVHRSVVRRIKSRFMGAGGSIPGSMILVSSATTHNAFISRKIEAAKTDPTVWVREYAAWDVKPPQNFCGDVFYVVIGSSTLRAKVLPIGKSPTEEEKKYVEDSGGYIISVPVEYWDDFESDLEGSIRDIAGRSTYAISAFISRLETIDECINRSSSHPFTVQEFTSGGFGSFIWQSMVKSHKRRISGGFEEEFYKPIRNPGKKRWIHIDTSLSGDSSGFAMGHVERHVEVVRRDEDGETFTDIAPYIVIDVVLRINPPNGEQIFLGDIRGLVYVLQSHGYEIAGVSTDSYQSADMRQQLEAKGIRTELVSVDTSMKPYDQLKSALYEHRIEYYEYEPLISELKTLELDLINGKVDHPVAGSKDVSDAVAGVVHGLVSLAGSEPLGVDSIVKAGGSARDDSWVSGGALRVSGPADMSEFLMPFDD